MNFKLPTFCIVVLSLFGITSHAQERKTALDGYQKYMHTIILPHAAPGAMITDNFLHNRLNFAWYANDNFTFKTSMRNRLFWGELVQTLPFVYDNLGDDAGFFDLSFLWASGESAALHTVFDRMNLTYQKGDLEIIGGRQRINWAMTMIWNPNDIFNSYSFFDFDYEERPGTDAVQVNCYTSATSSISVVYQLADSLKGSSIASKYRFNKRSYDFQFMGGYQREFLVVGGGWAGDIKGAGFKGEGTYFVPSSDRVGETQFVGSIELDYSLPNGMYFLSSYLFNSSGLNEKTGDYSAYYLDRSLSTQTLSPAMHNLFFQVSAQVTPLLNFSLATMLNPKDGSFFVGPTITWSVADNFDFMTAAQLFLGDENTLYGEGGAMVFGRFKYSF